MAGQAAERKDALEPIEIHLPARLPPSRPVWGRTLPWTPCTAATSQMSRGAASQGRGMLGVFGRVHNGITEVRRVPLSHTHTHATPTNDDRVRDRASRGKGRV